jgi:hypothetical protein
MFLSLPAHLHLVSVVVTLRSMSAVSFFPAVVGPFESFGAYFRLGSHESQRFLDGGGIGIGCTKCPGLKVATLVDLTIFTIRSGLARFGCFRTHTSVLEFTTPSNLEDLQNHEHLSLEILYAIISPPTNI